MHRLVFLEIIMLDNRLSACINYLVVASYVGVYFRKEVRIWVEHKFTA